ncbi:DUF2240 family protein, partial [Candidatus Woesearchaeota archaeon]|nr:DUF2240 family protein [Candidatus Woesearchaeota archaeon]
MINIPYDQLIAMILEKKQISREELESRIKAKMNQLSGLISRVGAAHIVANELGIRLLDSMGGKLKIGKILAGMRDVETLGKVVQVFEPRAFEGKLGQGKVGSIVIADETGQIRVVLWNDMANLIDRIKTGDIVRVIGGQARQNSGQRELHLNAKSRLIINPPGESVAEVKAPEPPKRYQISELQGNEAMAEIKATIVQVFDLRFYEVCPKCMKRLQPKGEEWHCQAHGKVQPDYSYVLNMIADDGSGTIRVVCFGRSVEAISGMTREELLRVREEPGLFDETKNNLLGSIMLFRGRALRNEMFDRIEFIARQVSPVDVDREIEMLKE